MIFKMPDEIGPFHAPSRRVSADHAGTVQFLLCQGAIGFQHPSHGFFKVGTGLLKGRPLDVGARQLLDACDIPFRHLAVNCRALQRYGHDLS